MKTLSCLLFSCLSDAEPCRYLQTHQALQVGEIALSTNRLWRVSTSGEQLGCSLLPKEQALMYWCVSTEQWGELTVFHAVLELIYLTGEINPYSPTRTAGTLLVSLQQTRGSEGANPAGLALQSTGAHRWKSLAVLFLAHYSPAKGRIPGELLHRAASTEVLQTGQRCGLMQLIKVQLQ